VDDTIVFHELSQDEVIEIADIFVERLRAQLANQGINLELTKAAKGHLAVKGYDAELGARPLRRVIQQQIEDVLAEKLLYKEFHGGQTIIVDLVDGDEPHLSFEAIDTPDALPEVPSEA
jgi:ATP-dependent Clp protease ATP-binding subunit ClpC